MTDRPMSGFMRVSFWLVAANALAGALVLLLFPTRTDELFFWPIKPAINAALFGALYLGGAAAVSWVTYRGRWEPARFLIPVLVSAGVMISVVTLLHTAKFVPGFRLGYWLLVYIGAPLLAVGFYVSHERGGANWAAPNPVRPPTRRLAVGLGGVLTLAGLVLIAKPELALGYWPWPMTPLMLRVFAAWFAAFGVGLLWFAVEREWTRLANVANLMIAASALDLVMIVVHRGDLTTTGPRLWLYVGHLALFGVVGATLHWLQRPLVRPSASPVS